MGRRTPGRPSGARLKGRGAGISPSALAALLAIAGAILRVWQYASNNSLWLDEAALARNILHRSPLDLLRPLDYAQVAPPGFLLAEKAAASVLGGGELSLRLLPLLCGLAAIALFMRIASRILTGWAVPYAVGLFALATPLVYFSSQVKQYSSDVLATLIVVAAALSMTPRAGHGERGRGRAVAAAALAGIAVPWFSQPAILVIAAAVVGLTIGALRTRHPDRRSTMIVGAAWTVSAALASLMALRSVPAADRAYLDWYWAGGFPASPWDPANVLWAWERLSWTFGVFATGLRRTNGGLGYPWSHLFVAFAIAGWWALWRRDRDAAVLVVLPVVATLAAAALHLYPFTGRVVTFLLPLLLLAVAAGVDAIATRLRPRLEVVAPVLLAIAAGSPLYAALTALPSERVEHLRPVMDHVSARTQPGDAVYVYYGAAHPFLYYAERRGSDLRGVTLGRCSTSDVREYLRDVDRFRGRPRVWIVATHARRDASELRAIVDYLDAIGRRLDTVEQPASSGRASNGAYGFLYDLSDPARLDLWSAATHAVAPLPADPGTERWACYGTLSTSAGL